MAKKNKEKEERKIYRDFTLDEFDKFTLELLAEGANDFRRLALQELGKRRGQAIELLCSLPAESSSKEMLEKLDGIIAGLEVARNYIRDMDDYEDLGGCSECGSI
jgi:hypothetical protein